MLKFRFNQIFLAHLFLSEEIEEKYKGKLQKHMTGPSYEIVSRLMKSLAARKITIPGSFTG